MFGASSTLSRPRPDSQSHHKHNLSRFRTIQGHTIETCQTTDDQHHHLIMLTGQGSSSVGDSTDEVASSLELAQRPSRMQPLTAGAGRATLDAAAHALQPFSQIISADAGQQVPLPGSQTDHPKTNAELAICGSLHVQQTSHVALEKCGTYIHEVASGDAVQHLRSVHAV